MGSIKTFRDGHISVCIHESPKHMFTSHWFQWMGWTEVEKYFALSLPLQAKHSGQRVRIAVVFQLCMCSKRLHKANGNRKPSSWVSESGVLHWYQLKFSESTPVTSLTFSRFLNHCEHPGLCRCRSTELSVPAHTFAEVCLCEPHLGKQEEQMWKGLYPSWPPVQLQSLSFTTFPPHRGHSALV